MPPETFHYATFSDVHAEVQTFAPGFEADDFHLMAPATEAIQRLRLLGGRWVEDHISIQGWDAVSDYNFVRTGKFAYLFQLGGLELIDLDRMKDVRDRTINGEDLSLNPTNFIVRGASDSGEVLALMDCTPPPLFGKNFIQLHRFRSDLTSEVLLQFPEDDDLIGLSDGFVVCPPFYEPTGPRTPYQAFAPNGTPQPGPLQQALNELLRRGLRVTAPHLPAWGQQALWTTSLHRPWAMFSYADSATGPTSRTWVMTLPSDSNPETRTSPLVFETRHQDKEFIQCLALSPNRNLFFATVNTTNQAADPVMLWIGRVLRKDGLYRAECFRVQPFDQLQDLTFSRDGSTIAFFAMHQNQWQVAGARLDDIVAEVNRRYPDAKFDLEELK
jgi:hypothetical protein